MDEDPWLKYTTYSCKAEELAYESGEYDRYMDRLQDAKDAARSARREEILDELGMEGECRNCDWLKEAFLEQYEDGDYIPVEDICHIQMMCKICHDNEGDPDKQYDAIDEYFRHMDDEEEIPFNEPYNGPEEEVSF